MLEVKSMGNFRLLLYEINRGCVCLWGLASVGMLCVWWWEA